VRLVVGDDCTLIVVTFGSKDVAKFMFHCVRRSVGELEMEWVALSRKALRGCRHVG
jgi:hypothetical protein